MTATDHQPHRSPADGGGPHPDLLGDPLAQLSAALLLSLALWLPFGMAVLRDELDLAGDGLRYLVAFVGCRVAVSGIAHLLLSYRALARVEVGDDGPARPGEDGAVS
jgi:hypothetical protein